MVLPGFLSGDWATKALRADLRRAGFRCYAWGLGFNRGATADIIERIDGRVQWIIDRTGRAPALVGWSLGGIYAREYAKHHPGKVARVVTLGSPFSGSRRANRAWRLYHLIARHPVDNPPIDFHPAPRPEMPTRSEEHTSELQSLMRISYAVFCLKKKNQKNKLSPQITTYITYIDNMRQQQANTKLHNKQKLKHLLQMSNENMYTTVLKT